MENSDNSFWLIVKRTGIIIALLAAALELHFLIQDARSTLDAVKLNALNHILPLIDTKYEVRKTESEFLDNELTEATRTLNEEYTYQKENLLKNSIHLIRQINIEKSQGTMKS